MCKPYASPIRISLVPNRISWTLFAHFTKRYGYGRIDVMNSTHLSFNFVPVDGTLNDAFWIVKA